MVDCAFYQNHVLSKSLFIKTAQPDFGVATIQVPNRCFHITSTKLITCHVGLRADFKKASFYHIGTKNGRRTKRTTVDLADNDIHTL